MGDNVTYPVAGIKRSPPRPGRIRLARLRLRFRRPLILRHFNRPLRILHHPAQRLVQRRNILTPHHL